MPNAVAVYGTKRGVDSFEDTAQDFFVDLRGPDQFRKLIGLLRAKGYSTARIEKILGGNFLAYAQTIWGA